VTYSRLDLTHDVMAPSHAEPPTRRWFERIEPVVAPQPVSVEARCGLTPWIGGRKVRSILDSDIRMRDLVGTSRDVERES
jgi:hypothetical protein